MPENQPRPDQRSIDAFRKIIDRLNIEDGYLGFNNGYPSAAIWPSSSNNLLVMTLTNDDCILLSATYIPGEVRAMGLKGTKFDGNVEGIALQHQYIIDTVDQLVETAYRFAVGLG